MNTTALALPERTEKPRKRGLTVVIDSGAPPAYFQDVIEGSGDLIDVVKFGWGTSVVSDALERKIACLRERDIDYYFGGTLFEKFHLQGQDEAYIAYCQRYGCRFVEISNGAIALSNHEKARQIARFAREFQVLSEVGYKDSERSLRMPPAEWIACIQEDLAAGAERVITEGRESGASGVYRSDGEPRFGLIEEILTSDLDIERIIFEAPRKEQQVYFIRRIGANVNLANIALADTIGLETLRLGLRADTLTGFD
jgi:phosphosulfolactate synthase